MIFKSNLFQGPISPFHMCFGGYGSGQLDMVVDMEVGKVAIIVVDMEVGNCGRRGGCYCGEDS